MADGRMSTSSIIKSFLIVFYLIVVFHDVEAYNEESPMMKWSPRYLYGNPGVVDKSANSFYTPRMSRFDRFYEIQKGVGHREGSLGSRNPGFYSRAVRGVKRSTCLSEGETCIYRSALVGAVIKLPCCKGSFCVYKENKFVCMEKEGPLDNFEDYNTYENVFY